jgi:hypothetical protein
MAAIAMDYVARQKIGGANLNFFIVKQFAILPPSVFKAPVRQALVPRVLELTYTSADMRPWARDLGYSGPLFAWNEERRAILRAELDAGYSYLYGLSRDELRYILNPSDIYDSDFPSETFRVLKDKEIREYGEYRTARLVLEAWDRFSENGEFRRWVRG